MCGTFVPPQLRQAERLGQVEAVGTCSRQYISTASLLVDPD